MSFTGNFPWQKQDLIVRLSGNGSPAFIISRLWVVSPRVNRCLLLSILPNPVGRSACGSSTLWKSVCYTIHWLLMERVVEVLLPPAFQIPHLTIKVAWAFTQQERFIEGKTQDHCVCTAWIRVSTETPMTVTLFCMGPA